MNASFCPFIIPDQSNEFYEAKNNFYHVMNSFDINDLQSLENLKNASETCKRLFDDKISNDGGMIFIKIYTETAVALCKLYHENGKLDPNEKKILRVNADNPCYTDFGGIDFQKYVHEHL